MRKTPLYILLISSVFMAISGCGNKGPLYLPPEPVEQPETSAPAQDES